MENKIVIAVVVGVVLLGLAFFMFFGMGDDSTGSDDGPEQDGQQEEDNEIEEIIEDNLIAEDDDVELGDLI